MIVKNLNEKVTIVISSNCMLSVNLGSGKTFGGRENIMYRSPRMFSCFVGKMRKKVVLVRERK